MLRAIVNYKVKIHKKDKWLLSGLGLKEVCEDFELLHDFHYGSQKRDLNHWVSVFDTMFLASDEQKEYENLVATDDEKAQWLTERSEQKFATSLVFHVSLCRLLQSDDFDLNPKEAYWLGLIDEVPGADLPNLRVMFENAPPLNE